MKLNDLTDETPARRPTYSWPKLLKGIYDYVERDLKENRPGRRQLDALSLRDVLMTMRQTDEFHPYDHEHDLLHELSRGHDLDAIFDPLASAIAEVEEKIKEYLGNWMNHAPGHVAPSTWDPVDSEDIKNDDLIKIIKISSPTLCDWLETQQKIKETAYQERRAAKNLSDAAKITPAHRDQFKKKFIEEFDNALRGFIQILDRDKKRGSKYYVPSEYGLKNVTQAEFEAVKKPVDLAKLIMKTFKGKVTPAAIKYVWWLISEHDPVLPDHADSHLHRVNPHVVKQNLKNVAPIIKTWLEVHS